jgi:carbonic anhydrase
LPAIFISGPDKWSGLKPEYSICASGKAQSPINIVTANAIAASLGRIDFTMAYFQKINGSYENNGETGMAN